MHEIQYGRYEKSPKCCRFAVECIYTIECSCSAENTNEVSTDLPHTVLPCQIFILGETVYAYAKRLLTESLRVTEPQYGSFELIVSDQETAQERQLRSLEHNMLT